MTGCATLRAALLASLLGLSACAGSVATPVSVQGLPSAQKAELRIMNVAAEAQQGVVMTPADLDRVIQQVKAEIGAQFPTVLASAGTPTGGSGVKLKMVFTQYDAGNAFARFMLAGLGQIRIDADVLFVDNATDQVIGRYQVSKQFAFGGIYGGTTTIQDVEKGFAKSVAEILRDKTVLRAPAAFPTEG